MSFIESRLRVVNSYGIDGRLRVLSLPSLFERLGNDRAVQCGDFGSVHGHFAFQDALIHHVLHCRHLGAETLVVRTVQTLLLVVVIRRGSNCRISSSSRGLLRSIFNVKLVLILSVIG